MFSLGLDFGTNSVRALLLSLKDGEEVATSVYPYLSGEDGVITKEGEPHLARQNPDDYLISLEKSVRKVLKIVESKRELKKDQIVGIGIDTTGSTPLPVDKNLKPLSFLPQFQDNLNALAWLWKDHTGSQEAEEITELAKNAHPEYLAKCGGTYSSEWFFSKILHLSRVDPELFDAADSFIEITDYIPAVLSGKKNSKEVVRGICAAGHKAMFNEEWGGLPSEDFLSSLSPKFKGLREKLYSKAYPAGVRAGTLCEEWAERLGLPVGIPISVGAFDAHMGAVGAGIAPGILVKIMGTSACDTMVFPKDKSLPDISGLCGVVPDSILPGYIGLEAGQSAVGDIFQWFIHHLVSSEYEEEAKKRDLDLHQYLSQLASRYRPGETGLLALDWNNGNRTILVDQRLTGLILGQTLDTKAEEIYRTLIEATAFGARVIIEHLEKYGVKVSSIIACGGLPEKNEFLMQIYSDVTGREIKGSKSSQTCALGSAIFGAVAAGKERSGLENAEDIQKRVCKLKERTYIPNLENRKIYDKLYSLYLSLHNSFGRKEGHLFSIMKELLGIKMGNEECNDKGFV